MCVFPVCLFFFLLDTPMQTPSQYGRHTLANSGACAASSFVSLGDVERGALSWPPSSDFMADGAFSECALHSILMLAVCEESAAVAVGPSCWWWWCW